MKTAPHILVIRLSAMGDVAMLVPVLWVLTQTYPELKITVLSKPFFNPLFNGIPNISILNAEVYARHKGFGIISLASEAAALKLTAVADVHNVLRSKIIRFLLWIRGIKTSPIDKGRSEKKLLTNANGAGIKPIKSTHRRYAAVFGNLGYPINLKEHIAPKPKQLSSKLQELVGTKPRKLIGIAPFAAHEGKMYPLSFMKRVIEDLNKTNSYQIFLFGGGKKEITKLNKLAFDFETVSSIAGQFTFEEELALISNLDIMLSMDSGNGHLAAMYGIPVITLWGVTHPYTGFKPFNQPNENQIISNRDKYPLIPTSVYGNKLPKGYEKIMESIPPELVVEKVLKTL